MMLLCLMKLEKKDIQKIEAQLDHGDKKHLAAYLGIVAPALSRHLTTRSMPRSMYLQILNYIELLKIGQAPRIVKQTENDQN